MMYHIVNHQNNMVWDNQFKTYKKIDLPEWYLKNHFCYVCDKEFKSKHTRYKLGKKYLCLKCFRLYKR